uniref:Ig-like domain-containing protein n=1 Tax=Oncorhynchus mykiss TaxID=8022 RepID=A0A8C7RZ98_ONCMY
AIMTIIMFGGKRGSLQPREVAAPGSDITLSCSLSKNLNLNNLVVNWQRGESEVVHSYYHGRDQLERQSVVYKGRTHLFEDQLTVGNASLRLSDVQPSDQGPYTCDVTDEQGSTQEKLQLLVAAPYDEPRISIQATCDGFVVTFSASQGFPQPEVVWKGVMGSTNTTMELDSKGLYELESEVTLRLNSTLTQLSLLVYRENIKGGQTFILMYILIESHFVKAELQYIIHKVQHNTMGVAHHNTRWSYVQCLAKVFGPLELCDLLTHFRLQT